MAPEYGEFWSNLGKKLKWVDPFTYSDMLLAKINPGNHWTARFVVELATAFITAFVIYSVVGLIMGTGMPLVIVVSGSMEPVLHRGDVILLQGVHNASDVKAQEIWVNRDLNNLAFWDFGSAKYFVDQSNPQSPLLCEYRQGKGLYSVVVDGNEYRFNTEGGIVVYFSRFPGRASEPIIHRAVLKIHALDGDYFLTKGDSVYNTTFDEDCGRVVLGRPECSCITLYPIKASEIQGKAFGWIPAIGYVKLILIDDLTQLLQGCPSHPELNCPNGCCFP